MISNELKPGQLLFAKLEIDLDEVPIEKLAAYTAVKYYLTVEDEPPDDVTNLEQVKRYLQSFDHLCEMEAWEAASEILLSYTHTTTNQELRIQLRIWRYYRELASLYNRILGKLNSRWDAICLNGLGLVYYGLGEYTHAIEFYQQCLAIARATGDQYREGRALGNLGLTFYAMGQYHQAIKYTHQYLQKSRTIGDSQGEGNALGNLGIIYKALGKYHRAINYAQQHLDIARKIGDRLGEGNALGNLGTAHYPLGKYHQAIDYAQQHLDIARAIGDRLGEGNELANMGLAYHAIGEYTHAIALYQQRLTITQVIEDRQGEGETLCRLGATLIRLDLYSEALKALHTALEICNTTGNRSIQAEVQKVLAEAYQILGPRTLAIEYCNRALSIAAELGIPLVKECQELKEKLLSQKAYRGNTNDN
jgi:tetratricopeptide (TPR) repeat protein